MQTSLLRRVMQLLRSLRVEDECLGDTSTPSQGELWVLTRAGDPFPPKYDPVKIREVRKGWVRYDIGKLFPDQRRTISEFTAMYKRVSP